LELSVDVVEISSRLYRAEAKPKKRLPGLPVSILFDEPTGALWAKEDPDGKRLLWLVLR
jgi:hypothetical protein